MAYTRNGVEFRLDEPGINAGDLYHYEAFKSGNVSREELRKEYSRLRQVANSRLDRMAGTKYERSQTYRRNAGKYTTLAEIENEALSHAKNLKQEAAQKYVDLHVAKKLDEMYKFLTAKSSSIRGMQAIENRMIETFREKGLTFINKNNIQQFGEYMDYLRAIHKGRMFDSERAADVFGTAVRKGINPEEIAEDFEYWKEHEAELATMPRISNAKNRTAAEYKRLLENGEKTIKKNR